MKITLFRVVTESEREQLQELIFRPRPEEDDSVINETVNLPGAEPLGVNAVYWNANLTLLVTQGDRHMATLMCNWREVTPHFAIRLMGGAFIEFYFEK